MANQLDWSSVAAQGIDDAAYRMALMQIDNPVGKALSGIGKTVQDFADRGLAAKLATVKNPRDFMANLTQNDVRNYSGKALGGITDSMSKRTAAIDDADETANRKLGNLIDFSAMVGNTADVYNAALSGSDLSAGSKLGNATARARQAIGTQANLNELARQQVYDSKQALAAKEFTTNFFNKHPDLTSNPEIFYSVFDGLSKNEQAMLIAADQTVSNFVKDRRSLLNQRISPPVSNVGLGNTGVPIYSFGGKGYADGGSITPNQQPQSGNYLRDLYLSGMQGINKLLSPESANAEVPVQEVPQTNVSSMLGNAVDRFRSADNPVSNLYNSAINTASDAMSGVANAFSQQPQLTEQLAPQPPLNPTPVTSGLDPKLAGLLKSRGYNQGIDAILTAEADKQGVSMNLLRKILANEGGMTGNISTTGARGPFQFTVGTWNGFAKTPEGKAIGMRMVTDSNTGICGVDPRDNMEANLRAGVLLARDNIKYLMSPQAKALGLAPTEENVYLTHAIGYGGLTNIAKGNYDKKTISDIMNNGGKNVKDITQWRNWFLNNKNGFNAKTSNNTGNSLAYTGTFGVK